MSQKRKNMPGYVQKTNSRGHKYWAKDGHAKKVSTIHDVGDGMVLSEDDARIEVATSPIFTHYDIANGHLYEGWSQDGFTCVSKDTSGGIVSVVFEGPSGQHYSMQSLNWQGYMADDVVSVTPVQKKVDVLSCPVVHGQDFIDDGEQAREIVENIKSNGKIPWYMMEKEFSIPVFDVEGGTFSGEPVRGFVDPNGEYVFGGDNGELFHDREYSVFHSFSIDGNKYVVSHDVHSEDGDLGGDFSVIDDRLTFSGDIYKVGDDEVDTEFISYSASNYQTFEVDVE